MFKVITKKNIITLGVMFFLLSMSYFFLNTITIAAAADDTYGNYGLDGTVSQVELPGKAEIKDKGGAKNFVASQIGKILGYFLAFTGVVFMVLIIIGGTIWMNAQGNEQNVTKAKELIIAAVIGLILTLAAYAITKFLGGFLLA